MQNQIIASKGYDARARDSINFRKFSPCIARARRERAGLTALPPMRDFASLIVILGKYCTFVCGTLFGGIKLNELYPPQTKFHRQKCNTCRVLLLEKRSRGICYLTMAQHVIVIKFSIHISDSSDSSDTSSCVRND